MAALGGIDLGGTKIQAVVVDGEMSVRGSARAKTPTGGGPGDVAAAMAETLRAAMSDAGTDQLDGVGVGSPGDVDASSGTVSSAHNLPDWEGSFELGPYLADAFGAPAAVGNDVQVATEAEVRLGAGQGYSSLLGVFWGTGVGGGIVLDGELWIGRGAAGEIGHIIVRRGGAREPGGLRGTVEANAGRAAMEAKARKMHAKGAETDLFEIMKKRDRDRLTSGVWARALKEGDPVAEKLFDRAVKALGAGIASAVNLLDVEAVVLGGGLGVRFGDSHGPKIEKRMREHLFQPDRPPAFRVAELGDFGGAIGAALLCTTK